MRRILVVGCLLCLLAGCATVENRHLLRDETLGGYAAALRWGGIASAWHYVDPAVRRLHPLTAAQKARYNSVDVAEYDVSGLHPTGPATLEQTARIGLVVKASQHAYSVVDHQTWHWDAKARHWWLESGLPDITSK